MRGVRVEQELEGLGQMPLYFVEFAALRIELPAAPEGHAAAQIRETYPL